MEAAPMMTMTTRTTQILITIPSAMAGVLMIYSAMGAIFTTFSAGQLTAACVSGCVVDRGRGHIGLATVSG